MAVVKIMVIMAALRSKLNDKGLEELDALPMLASAVASAIQGSMVNTMPCKVWRIVQGALSALVRGCVCLCSGDEFIKGPSSTVCFDW